MNLSKQTLPNETEPERNNGILPAQSLRTLIQNGVIAATDALPIKEEQIQPASIDLRLGPQAFHVRASFLPGKSATLLEKVHVEVIRHRRRSCQSQTGDNGKDRRDRDRRDEAEHELSTHCILPAAKILRQ